MNDDGAPLRHVRVIERSGPGSDHRLRVMGSAAEHIGCRHDDEGIPARADEASVEVGQKRALTTSSFGRLVPVGETLCLDPTHTFHRAQVILHRRDEEQSRSGALLLGDERAEGLPRRCDLREVGRGREARFARQHAHTLRQSFPVPSPQILALRFFASGRLLYRA